MTAPRLTLLAAAVAAAAASSGCGAKSAAPDRTNFSLPSSIATFWGYVKLDATAPQPYFAVANEVRGDLTLVDATNDLVVDAPVLLRPLAVPFPVRPALLASALLGDTVPGGTTPRPSLLVGVSAGSSVLQLVRTWSAPITVDADPVNGQAIDLGADVRAIVPLPSPAANTARLAVSLAGNKLAVVQYRRSPAGGDAIVKDTTDPTFPAPGGFVVHGLDFEPAALATVASFSTAPADAKHVYAATLDPLGPGAVHGVAEIDVSALPSLPTQPWTYRALDARAPTRLVAAAQLQERQLGSVAADPTAFTGQPIVTRVYAVLDEGSCGSQRRIDCGIVTLDPAKTPAPGDDHIPDDWAGWMPYRAPIQSVGRPVALAIAPPPGQAPPGTGNEIYAGNLMLLQTTGAVATTAVAVVADETGSLEFLDLGRFKVASLSSAPVTAGASATVTKDTNRLWIQDPSTSQFATSDTVASFIGVTAGYGRDELWKIAYQGPLPALQNRGAEAFLDASGKNVVLAVQIGDGVPGTAGRTLTQVARLWHPDLGVKVGDIVTFKAKRVPGCLGAAPPNTPSDQLDTVDKEFETTITQLVAPGPEAPGGAAVLAPRTRVSPEPSTPPEWLDCWNALVAALQPPATGLKGLLVTVEAGNLVLTGSVSGYAGRPQLGVPYVLQYKASATAPDEDALAAACPLADWDGTLPPPSCGGTCDRAVCEQLVLARKARRLYHLAEDCAGDAACLGRYPPGTYTFPFVNGPALQFQVGHDSQPGDPLFRGLVLTLTTGSGVSPVPANPGGAPTRPNGAISFDRSPWGGGYRFLVPYPGNEVGDVSPSVAPVSSNTIR